jgi:hypothetical protein
LKAGNTNRYDDSSNPEEFIQVYQMIIEAAIGDDQVNANFLPEASIYFWDQLCVMFIGNFQSTYERLSTAETLKTIRKKPDESL